MFKKENCSCRRQHVFTIAHIIIESGAIGKNAPIYNGDRIMEKILTAFCFTDIHNQQSMLDYPTTLRKSLIHAKELAIAEFGLADIAIIGGDNISDYPHWNKSCALPKKNFLDIKKKIHDCVSAGVKDGKVFYVA